MIPIEDIYAYQVIECSCYVAVDCHDGWVEIYRDGKAVGRHFLGVFEII